MYFLLILFLNSVIRLQLISIFDQQHTYRNAVHKYNRRENLKSFLDQIAFIKNAILKILVDLKKIFFIEIKPAHKFGKLTFRFYILILFISYLFASNTWFFHLAVKAFN